MKRPAFFAIGSLVWEPVRYYCRGHCGRIVGNDDGVLLRRGTETALFCHECAMRNCAAYAQQHTAVIPQEVIHEEIRHPA